VDLAAAVSSADDSEDPGLMRKRSLVIAGVLAGVLVIAGAATWRFLHLSDLVQIGVGYSARQTCACIFVSHRSPDSCRADLDSLAQRLMTVEVGAQQVTARSIAGLSRATARYEAGFGCSLVD
jgi:hypothetical protein